MFWKIEHMRGPTPEAKALQLKQMELLDAFYDARNRQPREMEGNGPEAKAALAAYDQTVVELTAMLGAEAPVGAVDAELASTFSDIYKSETGFRPRGHFTAAYAREWLEKFRVAA
ncbi:hypothetical protein [Burkholderia cenocepacia]|uniref:hypothetical protein n=1 Tax=Burkholderia cenocepacia TaxID=95486 RepID=UPI000761819C|nr:hypothetical protein [Burkholderia cenocepacia]KWU23422.1 hypothetical protein AS149_37165 [Burkholderia cenocepacia]